jgi:hypothetical protein
MPEFPRTALRNCGGGLGRGDLRRYGTVPHAGFGLGFEHTLTYVNGLATCATRSPSREPPETRDINAYYSRP